MNATCRCWMTQHVAATLAEILGEDRDARGIKLTRFRSSQMLDEEEDQAAFLRN